MALGTPGQRKYQIELRAASAAPYLYLLLLASALDICDLLLDTLAVEQICVSTMMADTTQSTSKNIHFFLNKGKTPINSHYSLVFVLLEQDRTDKLVDIGIIIEEGELLPAPFRR